MDNVAKDRFDVICWSTSSTLELKTISQLINSIKNQHEINSIIKQFTKDVARSSILHRKKTRAYNVAIFYYLQ